LPCDEVVKMANVHNHCEHVPAEAVVLPPSSLSLLWMVDLPRLSGPSGALHKELRAYWAKRLNLI
jgi:hypothetical protein